MAISGTSGLFNPIAVQPKSELKGQGARSSSALGSVGNLQYTAKQGGTARVGFIRTTLSDLRHFVANWQAKLTFFLTNAPKEARAQHEALVQNRKTNKCVANLLGDLTALAKDEKGRTAVARRLEELITLADGDLNSRKGWEQCLSSHMGQLKDMDLKALYDGVLGDPQARDAVLDRISPEASNPLRKQAAGALEVINAALDLRSAQDLIREPLANTVQQLSASPLDGQELHRQLSGFPQDAARLDLYLHSLPKGEPEKVLFALRPENLEAGRQALSRVTDGSQDLARATLDRLRTSAEGVIHARAQPALSALGAKMEDAHDKGDKLAGSRILSDLNTLIDEVQKACGSLPAEIIEDARDLVDGGMQLFLSDEDERGGSLKMSSLNVLKDAALLNLHRASHLHPLGLKLDSAELDRLSTSRIHRHVNEFRDNVTKLPMEKRDEFRQKKLNDALQVLSLISDDGMKWHAEKALTRIRT
ncbi:hypothetical protein [Alcaligenes sp. Marseille-Q7550]